MYRKSKSKILMAILIAFALIIPYSGFATTTTAAEAITIYTNGVIYTLEGDDWDKNPQECIVFAADGVIRYVGDNEGAEEYFEEASDIIDLEGKIVFPGFIDSHVHPPGTALTELFSIYLYGMTSMEQTLEAVAEYIEEHPDLEVYWGGGFSMGLSGDPRGPKRQWLDEICDDKPIILASNDGHNLWMNSKALEMNGITKATENPPGGTVQKDENGELWGNLTDAFGLVSMTQTFTPAQEMEALSLFQDTMIEWGYTGAHLILISLEDLSAPGEKWVQYLKDMEIAEIWKMRANLQLQFAPDNKFEDDLAAFKKARESVKYSSNLNVTTAKFFMDGVIEGQTGYLSEPYEPLPWLEPGYKGEPYWDVADLKRHFAALGKEGIQVYVHSIGDEATKETIDAMEYAQAQNPRADLRNVITHLQVVKDSDKVRMGKLNIIGNTQPFWHLKEPGWYYDQDYVSLGEKRAWEEYPVKSLMDAGVLMTFSGDHPVTENNSPFNAIEVAVTRNLYDPEWYEVDEIKSIDDPTWLLNPAERITAKEAIEAYTINGAYQLFMEDKIGSLKAGKFADMTVVSQDPLKVNPLRINETEVLATIFNGEVIYGQLEDVMEFPFTDVSESSWYYDDVKYVFENGLMNGTSDTLFSPRAHLTRGMVVTILYRAEDEPDVGDYDNPFTDVPEAQWFTDGVIWAAENEIVEGLGGGRFAPGVNITRQDLAVILMRYMNYKEINLPVTMDWRIYADESAIAGYAMDAIQTLNKLGIINGVGENADGQTIIDPRGNATRAQAAAMLHRFIELINK